MGWSESPSEASVEHFQSAKSDAMYRRKSESRISRKSISRTSQISRGGFESASAKDPKSRTSRPSVLRPADEPMTKESETSRKSRSQPKSKEDMEKITQGVARMFGNARATGSRASNHSNCSTESQAKQKFRQETIRSVQQFKRVVSKDDPDSPEQILRSLFKLALTRRNAGQHRMTRGVLVLSEDTQMVQMAMRSMAKLGRERRLNGQHRLVGRRLVHTQIQ